MVITECIVQILCIPKEYTAYNPPLKHADCLQESTSESVNGWYGVYLYGLGIGDQRITDLGRLLMATELRFAMFSHEYL